MKNSKNIISRIFGLVFISSVFTACEFEEPCPDPSGDFEVWSINDVTNAYEQIPEPLELAEGKVYDFVVSGTGQQFVLWFGAPGDSTAYLPTGSDFNDRYKNRYSKGTVATTDILKYNYRTTGTFEIVLVASSYSYSDDKYKESLTRKTVTVVPASE